MKCGLVYSEAPGTGDLKIFPHLLAQSYDLKSEDSLKQAIFKVMGKLSLHDFERQAEFCENAFNPELNAERIEKFYNDAKRC